MTLIVLLIVDTLIFATIHCDYSEGNYVRLPKLFFASAGIAFLVGLELMPLTHVMWGLDIAKLGTFASFGMAVVAAILALLFLHTIHWEGRRARRN